MSTPDRRPSSSPVVILAVVALLGGAGAVTWLLRGDVPAPSAPAAAPSSQAAEGHRVTHAQGTTVVPRNPQRVVVFDLAALDILQALGVDVLGVAGDQFPLHLAPFGDAKYRRMGTLFEPDYEALHAARPDLIITGGRSSAKYANLSQLAPTVDLPMGGANYLDTVVANTELLAGIFGKEEKARELVSALRQAVASLKETAATRGKGLVVLVTGGRISAYGPGSRFGILHGDFGVPVAVDGLTASLHGEVISSEFLREKNPDWLFVIDRDAGMGQQGGAQQVLGNELVRQTTAWQKGQVVYLDPMNAYLIGGGIQAVKHLRDQVAAAYAAPPRQVAGP
ncbi:siderophore ABC transporter substrate-binding protein [Myxococcus sp. K15C18031901]|uniref:siderophore ABC transporter substrate-binding protein n=1 Tax=Myxococcus dinghuensis TaxID=2906761 RepID=UPI0020A7E1C6|nr:ABC transporter substrate-binding protein [Myxococcus dinghuensis]MCP3098813.1 siderophore ABC transporter substrate-binding protein [Myxococcus dinghuensis]